MDRYLESVQVLEGVQFEYSRRAKEPRQETREVFKIEAELLGIREARYRTRQRYRA